MAKWTGFFKFVTPTSQTERILDNQNISGGDFSAYNWYSRLLIGSSSRMTRYREYEIMDVDVDISRALDTIAEEMTGNNPNSDMPLELDMMVEESQNISSNIVVTLRTALRYWCDIHDWDNRLFKVARNMIQYGDIFFTKKSDFDRWEYVHPKLVIAALVDKDDATKVIGWQLKSGTKKADADSGFKPIASTKNYESELINADSVVRFTLNDDMSESAPFGESILKPVYRTHKQKEMIEDSIIIYRIQRAPERRVFTISTGKMPSHRVKQYLEGFKHEIRQKKIPTIMDASGNGAGVESVYNPMSQSEDYFFSQDSDGKGSTVTTLPGGCLSLDTQIPLLDGRTLTLQQCIEEFNSGKQLWAYSVNPDNGKFTPGIVSWAGVTKKDTEVWEVLLDNGEKVICTPDHKFPVLGRGVVQAKDLQINDSFISHNTRKVPLSKEFKNTYEQIYDHKNKEWEFTHRLVSRAIKGTDLERTMIFNEEISLDDNKNVIHHNDHNRYNNVPTNLIKMSKKDHRAYHAELVKLYQPIATKKSRDKFYNDSEYREVALKRLENIRNSHFKKLKEDPIYREDVNNLISVGINKHFASLTEEERNKKVAQSMKNLSTATQKGLDKKRNDPEFKKQVYEKSAATLSKRKSEGGDLRQQTLEHVKRIKTYSINNQEIIYTQDMITIVRFLYDQGNIEYKQLLDKLNGTKEFVLLWNITNTPQDRKVFKIGTKFKHQHLDGLLKSFGYSGWKGFQLDRMQSMGVDNLKQYEGKYNSDEISLIKKLIDLIKISHKPSILKEKIYNTQDEYQFIGLYNKVLKRKGKGQATRVADPILQNVARYFGYTNFKHLVSDRSLFNHRVVSVRKLDQQMDVGTLTIDQNEKYNNYHNYALSVGIYQKNSNLGQLEDLDYFMTKVFRGLRVPVGWMQSGDNNSIINQGRVGTAYIEELRFAMFVKRLQGYVERILDQEFKKFLYASKINIDDTIYKIRLPEPSNFGTYRQQELDSALLDAYSKANDIPHMSKRFAMQRFLQLDEEDIILNERMLREEKGMSFKNQKGDLGKLYRPDDVQPEEANFGAEPTPPETPSEESNKEPTEKGGLKL